MLPNWIMCYGCWNDSPSATVEQRKACQSNPANDCVNVRRFRFSFHFSQFLFGCWNVRTHHFILMMTLGFRTLFLFLLHASIINIPTVEAKLGRRTRGDLQQQRPDEKQTSHRRLPQIQSFGADPTDHYPLGLCQGDCDDDSQCQPGLICYQRNSGDPIPGCTGNLKSRTDFCIYPLGNPPTMPSPTTNPAVAPSPTPLPPPPPSPPSPPLPTTDSGGSTPLPLVSYGPRPPTSVLPLKECEGDCNQDGDCGPGLICWQRGSGDPVPGCRGNLVSRTDYCVRIAVLPPPIPPILSHIRLKLYWQQGYYWQEETVERKWCMHCRHQGCKYGEKLYIHECSSKSQQFDLVPVASGVVVANTAAGSSSNSQPQPQQQQQQTVVLWKLSGNNLCLQRSSLEIFLLGCNSNNIQQQWFAKTGKFLENRFEMSPVTLKDHCVTQRHHPKDDEEILLEPCTQARSSDTSFWNLY